MSTSTSTSTATSTGGDAEAFDCEGDEPGRVALRAFWGALDREYAVFDVRLPDANWAALGNDACDALTDGISDDALFDVIISLAQNLDDGHTSLASDSRDEDAQVNVYPHDDVIFEVEILVEDNYLDQPLTWAADDWFAWGTIGEVGYLSLTSFDELSPSGDEDDDIAAANQAMDSALADLAGTTSLVVDVRANGGGWDYVALAVAARFAGGETIAWSEQVRNGPAHDDFGPWEDTFVDAAPADAYGGEVLVLTSGGTFSAAETFVLAMRVRDNVRVVGEPTSGHFSDLYGDTLPNGWEYTFSGERYRAADGEVYEAQGVPVDVPIAFDPTAFADGRDVMLEAALSEL